MGQTISAFADDKTAESARRIAAVEDRTVAQVAAAALAFYVGLPAEARNAIRYVGAIGGETQMGHLAREVARTVNRVRFELAESRLAEALDVSALEQLSEEEIMEEAVRLTSGVSSKHLHSGSDARRVKEAPEPAARAARRQRRGPSH